MPWSLAAMVVTTAVHAQPPVEYTVNLEHARSQMVDMTMLLRDPPAGPLEIALPVWRPGKYALIEPVTTMRDLTARTGAGEPLELTKKDKSSWTVTVPNGAEELILDYRIYANSIGDRTRHADDSHAFLSPSSVFLYAPALRGQPLTVRIDTPAEYQHDWQIAGGLEADTSDPSALHAPNYDVLVDTPLEIGRHEKLTFEVEGKPHEIIIWNPTTIERTLSADRITGDFEKIVREHLEIFGDLPYQRYVFLIHCYPTGGGGTEHLNSTIMGCRPDALREEAAFKKFLGLVSHEFFHTWNVKQFRPAGIHPYDYQKENYTDLLWVAEGTTSYYDDLTLVRAGLMKPDDYLRALSNDIHTIRFRPGSAVQSLADSSTEAWTKFNKSWPDSVNTTVSFYTKGAQASLLLDMLVRQHSGNKNSLDDVMRDMYERFPLSGRGYTADDFREAVERAAGTNLEPFFENHIAGTQDLPFEDLVGAVGLELIRTGADKDKPAKPYLGLNISGDGSVGSVLTDGPAHAAGLIAGDQIIAADGRRIRSQSDLDAVINDLEPGDTLTFSLFRYDTLREIPVTLTPREDGKWTLRRVESPTAEQKAAYRDWCGQPWPGEESTEAAAERPRRTRRNAR